MTPVLIGYGQVNQHDDHPGVEPVDLMVAAARAAADPRVLEAPRLGCASSNVLSWRYRDPGLLLAKRLARQERRDPLPPESAATSRSRWSTRRGLGHPGRPAPTRC